jgi:oligoendopeptidase F
MFRQVMFAEFEYIIHKKQEEGEALTCDEYKKIYTELNRLYYGPEMVVDEEIAMEWARIPHFYRAFYVYKYATGFASAIALSRAVLSGEEGRDRYLNFLKSGGSKFPLDLLKDAGVDLTRPETVAEALKTFGELVSQMEELMKD